MPIISILLSSAFAFATPLSLLDEGTHCVAYKTMKTVMLVSSSPVIGKNCDISVQVLPEVGGLYHIEVNIPIKGFQSGDTTRDEDVSQTLKADVRPEMTFKSKAMTADQWRALFKKGDFDIDGELTIGDKTFPLKLASHYEEKPETPEIDGIAKVHFQDFDIKPPKVFLGIVAKSKTDLELHYHFLGNRILGADSIRPDPKPATEAAAEAEHAEAVEKKAEEKKAKEKAAFDSKPAGDVKAAGATKPAGDAKSAGNSKPAVDKPTSGRESVTPPPTVNSDAPAEEQ